MELQLFVNWERENLFLAWQISARQGVAAVVREHPFQLGR